jgi:cellulose synthase/poly-beta-1,6-N-acetylglucosamine synthase-like glycosyltransferase
MHSATYFHFISTVVSTGVSFSLNFLSGPPPRLLTKAAQSAWPTCRDIAAHKLLTYKLMLLKFSCLVAISFLLVVCLWVIFNQSSNQKKAAQAIKQGLGFIVLGYRVWVILQLIGLRVASCKRDSATHCSYIKRMRMRY